MKTTMYNNPDKTLTEVGELPLTFECTDGISTLRVAPILDPTVDFIEFELYEFDLDETYTFTMTGDLWMWFPTVEELSNTILYEIISYFKKKNISPTIIAEVYAYALEFINRYADDLKMIKVPDDAMDYSPKFSILADDLIVKMLNGDAVVIYKNDDSVTCIYLGDSPSDCHVSRYTGSSIWVLVQAKQFIHESIFFDPSNNEHEDILKTIVDYLTD